MARSSVEVQFEEELEDRFGTLPAPAHIFLQVQRVWTEAHAAWIARIDAGLEAIAFTPRTRIDLGRLGFQRKEIAGCWLQRIAAADDRIQRILDCVDELIDPA